MAYRVLNEGEVGEVHCDYCGHYFEFIGNGEWIPTICPKCEEEGKGLPMVATMNTVSFDDLDRWFWDGITEE